LTRTIAVSLVLLAAPCSCPFFAFAQSPLHPLDGLTTQEYWTVYDVLSASGHLDADTHFASVLLHEPDKSAVLAWKPGTPFPREADALLQRKEKVIEARVDIAARKLSYWKEVPGVQGPFTLNEILGMSDAILADDRVKKALARRGVRDLNSVECAALPIGYLAFPEQKTNRIGSAECALIKGAYHTWGRSIGGLEIEVDMANKKILQVHDEEVTPLPGASNYEELPEIPRPGSKPAVVTQPLGPSFQINNGEVSWQNWHFRFRLDSRVGPVLNVVSIEDGGKRRSVLYEGMLSELFVPYMDPTRGWSTRTFIDAGEFYPGGVLQSLREGLDCPSNAVYFEGISANDKGNPVLKSRLACLFERFAGDVAWRHGDAPEVWGRPSRTLVLRSAAVIGNYDYLLDWRFEQDGSIRVAVGATGVIETRQVKQENSLGENGHDFVEQFGQLVAKNTLGVDHDHFFSFRLDLDVDGPQNSFMIHRLVRKELPPAGPRKSIWIAEPRIAAKEADAMMDIHLDQPSMWLFVNPAVTGPLGHPTGYEIMPGATAASVLDPDDGPQKVGAFSMHQLWVTPYRPNELYAAGTYPNSSPGDDGLAAWTRANRPIEKTDIVAWYTMGFHHVPREEDWPVMPTMWHDFVIRPFHFFPQNPALTLPKQP
jgi:primary-amine oxidase